MFFAAATLITTPSVRRFEEKAWRGRAQTQGASDDVALGRDAREVMQVSRDQSQIEGRWFWGGYDEFGIDVTLRRAGTEPVILGADRLSLKTGSIGQQVTIFGDNLPSGLATADISLGSGVTVKRIAAQSPFSSAT